VILSSRYIGGYPSHFGTNFGSFWCGLVVTRAYMTKRIADGPPRPGYASVVIEGVMQIALASPPETLDYPLARQSARIGMITLSPALSVSLLSCFEHPGPPKRSLFGFFFEIGSPVRDVTASPDSLEIAGTKLPFRYWREFYRG
jgi:hypothetical protein